MDAFAVAICKGLGMRRINYRHTFIIALFFGGFQALMPFLGWLLGSRFAQYITRYDHWIAFVLLALIGANMVKESFGGDEQLDDDYSAKAMLPLAIATGAGANSRVAIGTGIIGGTLTATLLAIFFVPVFFVVVRRRFPPIPQREDSDQD